MYGHENWDNVKACFNAWWHHEMDEPLIQILSPRKGCLEGWGYDGWALVRPGITPEQMLRDYLRFCESTWFGGVAFPNQFFNLGPGALAAFSTGFLHFDPISNTSWFENPQPWDIVETYHFEENAWYHLLTNAIEIFKEPAKGEIILGMTDLGGILDVLASFRGSETLAMDLLLEPDRVHRARQRILEDWNQVYNQLLPQILEFQEGMSTWMGLWCAGRYYPLQCDFSAMISPEQFREFVLPDIIMQCKQLDYSIYHLDGPGQIAHLDMLLEIEELDGIQWVPGEGNPQCESPQWWPLYDKILASGKLLVLNCFKDIRQVAGVLTGLPRNGILMSTWARSEEEGRIILNELRRL